MRIFTTPNYDLVALDEQNRLVGLVSPDGEIRTFSELFDGANNEVIQSQLDRLAPLFDQTPQGLKDRQSHIGNMPATNLEFADGQTGEVWRQSVELRLSNLTGVTPANTVQPSAPTGTKAVGNDLTANNGTWTGASSYRYQWWRINATTGEFTQIGATTQTYRLQAADATYLIACAVAGVGSNGVPSAYVMSAFTTAISATAPTNTGAVPSIDPAGSQAVGQEHIVDVGGWTGASTYGVQFYLDGAPSGARTSTLTFTTQAAQVGKVLTFDVIAYSSLGVASSPVAGSNSVTITGAAPAVTNIDPPVWPNPVYFGQPMTYTMGNWNGAIRGVQSASDLGREWRFFLNAETTPYLAVVNTLNVHTPRAPAVVGDTIYVEETVFDATTGLAYPPVRSVGAVIQAAPATFAAALTAAGSAPIVLTVGVAMTPLVVANATGGTAPYAASITNGPAGLSISVSGGNISLQGTPQNVATAADFTLAVTDAALAGPTNLTLNIQIQAASSTQLPVLSLTGTSVAISGANTSYDGVTNKVYNGTVVCGPNGDGRDIHRLVNGAPSISGGVRSEILWLASGLLGKLLEGVPNWWYIDFLWDSASEFPPSTTSYDEQLWMQSHTPYSGDTQPDIAFKASMQSGQCYWRIAGTANAPSGGTSTTTYNPPNFGHQTWLQGTRLRFIVEMVPGWLASHGAYINIWRRNGSATAWTQLVTNYTNYPNVHNHGGNTAMRSYLRKGGYKWSTSVWTNSSIKCIVSRLYYNSGGNRFDEAAAVGAALPN